MEKTNLLKVHGDIADPDNIIITSKDYENFKADTIIWGHIKLLLSTHAVVFIGYSLTDPNVKEMLDDIIKRLKGKQNPFYFINREIPDQFQIT